MFVRPFALSAEQLSRYPACRLDLKAYYDDVMSNLSVVWGPQGSPGRQVNNVVVADNA